MKCFVPDCKNENVALQRTTALCIAAHQDDIEIMAFSAIAECFGSEEKWFTGVTVTNGAGSVRIGKYANYSNEQIIKIREVEQNTAASVGRYSAQIQLGFTSSEVKDSLNDAVINEIVKVIRQCRPEVIYTHNLADEHDTHVAVALRTIVALRNLSDDEKPKKVYGMEIWRSLDWLCKKDKVVFDASAHPNIAEASLGVYDSQIMGGKRYDVAIIGRRAANATFLESHRVDEMTQAIYSIELTELMNNNEPPFEFIKEKIKAFEKDVENRLEKLSKIDGVV
jgi:LmbE family N-acetylglucosaminyl deacetylase